MASLPPKPVETSPEEKEEKRFPVDERDRPPVRSMAQQPRYRGERPFENDRPYARRNPRGGPPPESYADRGYDTRREDDLRRRDFGNRDRERASWDREDRGPRFGRSAPVLGRNRREFDRDRVPDRGPYQPPPDRYREPYDYPRRDRRAPSPFRRGMFEILVLWYIYRLFFSFQTIPIVGRYHPYVEGQFRRTAAGRLHVPAAGLRLRKGLNSVTIPLGLVLVLGRDHDPALALGLGLALAVLCLKVIHLYAKSPDFLLHHKDLRAIPLPFLIMKTQFRYQITLLYPNLTIRRRLTQNR